MRPTVIVRPEEAGDHAMIRAVHAAAFPAPAEARLVDALRAAGRLRVSLVALDRDAVIGHVAFGPVTVGEATGFGLAPVAVLPPHQRRGIGAALLEAGLAACRASEVGFVVVLDDSGYYGRFGFAPASRFGLRDEYGGGDAFQALELRLERSRSPRDSSGTLRSSPG